MREFLYKGRWHKADDNWKYFAVDRDGDGWLYEQKPDLKLDEGYWDSEGESEKLPYRISNDGWATSVGEIDDWLRAA